MIDYESYFHTSHTWLVHALLALGFMSYNSTLSLVQPDAQSPMMTIAQARLQVKGQVKVGEEEYTITPFASQNIW